MKHSLGRTCLIVLLLPFTLNIVLTGCLLSAQKGLYGLTQSWLIIPALLLLSLFYGYLHLFVGKTRKDVGHRLSIMIKGRSLCGMVLYCMVLEAVLLLLYHEQIWSITNSFYFWFNLILFLVLSFLLLGNGILRIFFTSKRLRMRLRVVMVLAMWIPVLNVLVLLYAMHKVKQEFEFDCYKQGVRDMRKESELCSTAYPLLLVHGIGFRDLRYFNYWGRIPKELTRYGASVYYGNQEALGTIVQNAQDIKIRIQEIITETGCEKVNILAHSKGGLDARYAISMLGMAPYVASLTTLSTPHWGCRIVDIACQLPDGLYRMIAKCFDRTFTCFGDQHPDFYTATHQFSTKDSLRFNEEVQDMTGVYYQSYASKMKGTFSDPLLWLPYLLIQRLEGENDGLVSITSAQWGKFQGVVQNKQYRGISHGDIIDLKREDYHGFDVIEWFVTLIAQLKKDGF